MSWRIRLHRLGQRLADGNVEPSCGIMDIVNGSTIESRTMTDCGLVPRYKTGAGEQRFHAPDPEKSVLRDGRKIDAVRVTHVHGDHFAYLPAFASYLSPRAKVWMTRPSAGMAPSILQEGPKIAGKRGDPPPYDYLEMCDILERIEVIERPGEHQIVPGFTDYVDPTGHIHGACSFTTRVRGVNIEYAGDWCGHDQPGVRGRRPRVLSWRPRVIAGSDCTYGADKGSDRRTWKEEMDRGFDTCVETYRRGHPVIWFSFGVHREGAIGAELARRGLPELCPVYLDGSGREFTRLMMGEWGRWCELDVPLDLRGVAFIKNKAMREEILGSGQGYAILTTPGMGGPGGIGTLWRRDALPNPDAAVIFTGYCAEDSDGARIIDAAARRDKTGEEVSLQFEIVDDETRQVSWETIPIRCKVVQIRTGSHEHRGGIVNWFREECRPEVAVLNHGSRQALDSLEQELRGDIPHLFRADKNPTIEIEL